MPEWNLDEGQSVIQINKEEKGILERGTSGPQAMICENK